MHYLFYYCDFSDAMRRTESADKIERFSREVADPSGVRAHAVAGTNSQRLVDPLSEGALGVREGQAASKSERKAQVSRPEASMVGSRMTLWGSLSLVIRLDFHHREHEVHDHVVLELLIRDHLEGERKRRRARSRQQSGKSNRDRLTFRASQSSGYPASIFSLALLHSSGWGYAMDSKQLLLNQPEVSALLFMVLSITHWIMRCFPSSRDTALKDRFPLTMRKQSMVRPWDPSWSSIAVLANMRE